MEFKVEIRNDGIWFTPEFGLTTCALTFFQFQYKKWFIEINIKPNAEDQEFEDILFIRILNDGNDLFIDDYQIAGTTTIENDRYSIYLEKIELV